MEGEGYRQISSGGCAVDIFDDPTESDGGIVFRRIDGVDGMRIGLGNSGEEMKIAGCQGCGGVDDSAYSRIFGATKLRAELEDDAGEGRTDRNWQGAAVGDIASRGKDLWGFPGRNGEHVDNRHHGCNGMCGRVGSKDNLAHGGFDCRLKAG